MTGSMTIKTNCQQCGKAKAIKTVCTFLPHGEVAFHTRKGCYKCGWHPDTKPVATETPTLSGDTPCTEL